MEHASLRSKARVIKVYNSQKNGFGVIKLHGVGADDRVDIRLRSGSKKYLVQCKNWRTRKLRVATVREMYGTLPPHSIRVSQRVLAAN